MENYHLYRIYENLSSTQRALDRLYKDENFRVERIAGPDQILTHLFWSPWARRLNKDGIFEFARGPHFVHSHIEVRNMENLNMTHLFRLDGNIMCITLSKDLNFCETLRFRLDYNKEFFLYRAELDEAPANQMSSS